MYFLPGYDYTDMDIFKSKDMIDFYQKVVEAEKFAYAQRGFLGDPDFLPKKNISKVRLWVKNASLRPCAQHSSTLIEDLLEGVYTFFQSRSGHSCSLHFLPIKPMHLMVIKGERFQCNSSAATGTSIHL